MVPPAGAKAPACTPASGWGYGNNPWGACLPSPPLLSPGHSPRGGGPGGGEASVGDLQPILPASSPPPSSPPLGGEGRPGERPGSSPQTKFGWVAPPPQLGGGCLKHSRGRPERGAWPRRAWAKPGPWGRQGTMGAPHNAPCMVWETCSDALRCSRLHARYNGGKSVLSVLNGGW